MSAIVLATCAAWPELSVSDRCLAASLRAGGHQVEDLRRLQLLAFKRYQDHRRYLDLERRFVADAVSGPADRG